ncbi:MAG: nascent polypeptide-associated complex protein [Promethearchaeota archaeon]
MVKLPKEMQNKEKNKPKRPQPVVKRDSQQFGSRQMRRKMAQQGIDMEQVNATRVIIEGVEKTLIIDQPEVFLMKQAGQEIYQIIGQGEEVSSETVSIENIEELEETSIQNISEMKPSITENDILLVATQANVDRKEAESVLKECEGDIAKAILYFKNRP